MLNGLVDAALGPGPAMAEGPPGDPGLHGPGSMAWRVMANPVVLALGGVAAVILQMGEPRIGEAIRRHSAFADAPLARMRRTAWAALVVAFGPTAEAQAMIARVERLHAPVRGRTSQGLAYSADDPELCQIVHLTASWGFLAAHRRLIAPRLETAAEDRFWSGAAPLGRAFGAADPPTSAESARAALGRLIPRLEGGEPLRAFLAQVGTVAPLGAASAPLSRTLAMGATALVPAAARRRLGLQARPLAEAAALGALRAGAAAAPEPLIVRAARRRAAQA